MNRISFQTNENHYDDDEVFKTKRLDTQTIELEVKQKNGFVCNIQISWHSSIEAANCSHL